MSGLVEIKDRCGVLSVRHRTGISPGGLNKKELSNLARLLEVIE